MSACSAPWVEHIHPDDRDGVAEQTRSHLEQRGLFEATFRMRTKGGEYRWFLCRGQAVWDDTGLATRMAGSTTDITGRTQAERALRRSERWLKAVIENEPACVKIIGPEGDLLEMNASGLAMLEAGSVEDVNEHGLIHFVLPESRRAFQALHRRVMGGESGLLEFEISGLRGTRRWLETHAVPISEPDSDATLLLGITRDITERKRTERELSLAASVFTHARESITITDATGAIIEVNDAFTRITGYSREEVMGKNPRLLSSGLQSKEFYAAMWGDLIGKGYWCGEIWNRRKNGELYAQVLTISAVCDAQGHTQQVDMFTGTVIGAEALIRWQHPERGLLLPAMFLPTIEEHLLAVDVGEWVIDAALAQMEAWQAAGLDIPVSVNVGARHLQQAGFPERLREILAAHPKVRPGDLEIEVLETSAFQDLVQTSRVIAACREIGVSFALDDFGTGYSSLTYLKRLPVTRLKIDQSFVRDMLDDPDDLAIPEGVLSLAAAFRREVIAEGVENVEQGAMLLQLGCRSAQGYGIARPMPAHEMPAWSAAWRTDPSSGDLPVVGRDDLPLRFASARHRAWITIVGNYLKDGSGVPPSVDHHQCHIGRWLDGKGLARHGGQPAFQAIESMHRRAHGLVAELLALHAQGRNPEARARLGEVHLIGDALIEQFNSLCREAGAGGEKGFATGERGRPR